MSDPVTPVFVIHGVGIRGVERYDGLVAKMQQGLGDKYELIPVYWGDLGASNEHLEKLIGQHPERSGSWMDWFADTRDYVAHVTEDYTKTWLHKGKGDRDIARGKYRAGKRRRAPIKQRIKGFAHDRFRGIRMRLTEWCVPYAADVLVYQSAGHREVIQGRFREIIAEKMGPQAGTKDHPITVIAHSLGGVIAFDMAVRQDNPLHYRQLITLGSQSSFLHIMDPRPGLAPFDGEPVVLPDTIKAWNNIWDDYDVIAYGVHDIFRLANGRPPKDKHIRCYRNRLQAAMLMRAHLGYWVQPVAHKAIRIALAR